MLNQGAQPIDVPDFMFQYREAANFPWASQAAWLYSQMLRWDDLAYDADDQRRAEEVFRPDIYRAALQGFDTPIPSSNSKLEGSVQGILAAGSTQGRLMLGADPFFDGRIFDPTEIGQYLDKLPKF
jgi:NitT/TauT family transport system ATP-binding protein